MLKSPFLAQNEVSLCEKSSLTFFFIFLKIYEKVLDNLVALVLPYIPWFALNFASKLDFGPLSVVSSQYSRKRLSSLYINVI